MLATHALITRVTKLHPGLPAKGGGGGEGGDKFWGDNSLQSDVLSTL